MENIRIKQAQNLIIKASEKNNQSIQFKKPQNGTINVEIFENLFKDIIHAEEFIYSSLPSHNLSNEEAKLFTDYIISARENIDSILADFKVIKEQGDKFDISLLSSNTLFLTTKNNFKKSLKKLGVDVQRIIVASVPLIIEDIEEINPKIPKNAIKGIEKKVEHIHNDIKRKINSLNPEKIIVLAEEDLNGQLLGKRAEEKYNALIYLNNNLKDISEIELINVLTN
ncbi:MAG: DUF2100 domain-containing protein [Methanobacteriaceae archaeon]|jgi:hypothetical protein|nr:DUF2100 domain-containing protein [Candidatus Methanorudis spinitermitis]